MSNNTPVTLKDEELRMFLKSLAWFLLTALIAGLIAWLCIAYKIWP